MHIFRVSCLIPKPLSLLLEKFPAKRAAKAKFLQKATLDVTQCGATKQ